MILQYEETLKARKRFQEQMAEVHSKRNADMYAHFRSLLSAEGIPHEGDMYTAEAALTEVYLGQVKALGIEYIQQADYKPQQHSNRSYCNYLWSLLPD